MCYLRDAISVNIYDVVYKAFNDENAAGILDDNKINEMS